MKKMAWMAVAALALTACNDKDEPFVEEPEVVITRAMADSIWNRHMRQYFVDVPEVVPTDPAAAYYEDYYQNWITTEPTRDVVINFDGEKASWDFQDDSKKTPKFVKISAKGAHVTIVNDSIIDGLAEGRGRMNYILRGTSADASLRIYSNKKFMVTLDNANLTNPRGAVINSQKSFEKKRIFINLQGTSTLCDGEVYSDTIPGEDEKGTIFSEGKMILMGDGTLNITSLAAHALAADDRIHIHSGVKLNVLSAAKDALHAKDEIVISGGDLRLFAQKDAVQSDTLLIQQGGRLLAAGKCAISAPKYDYHAGQFCLIGHEASAPTNVQTWSELAPKGYSIVVSNP